MNTGLLILRLVLGIAMAAHGSQKLVGWFGGPSLKGFASYREGIGFRPGIQYALAAGLTQLLSGLLVALGLGGPIGPALLMSVMLVATVTVHMGHGFFASTNGVELPSKSAVRRHSRSRAQASTRSITCLDWMQYFHKWPA
jgi:putative oxidoreductase